MQLAEEMIIKTKRGPNTYFLTIVDKENDSGIMSNKRLFYLSSHGFIGYLRSPDEHDGPHTINFEMSKMIVPVANIKGITARHNTITISFYLINGTTKSERAWVIRMKTDHLAHDWYQLLQTEKLHSTISSAKSIDTGKKGGSHIVQTKEVYSPPSIKNISSSNIQIQSPSQYNLYGGGERKI